MRTPEMSIGKQSLVEATEHASSRYKQWKETLPVDFEIVWPESYYDIVLWLEREIHKYKEQIQIYRQSGLSEAISGKSTTDIDYFNQQIDGFEMALNDLYYGKGDVALQLFAKRRDIGISAANRQTVAWKRHTKEERVARKIPRYSSEKKREHTNAYFDSLNYAYWNQAAVSLIAEEKKIQPDISSKLTRNEFYSLKRRLKQSHECLPVLDPQLKVLDKRIRHK